MVNFSVVTFRKPEEVKQLLDEGTEHIMNEVGVEVLQNAHQRLLSMAALRLRSTDEVVAVLDAACDDIYAVLYYEHNWEPKAINTLINDRLLGHWITALTEDDKAMSTLAERFEGKHP